MRDYQTMRNVLAIAGNAQCELHYTDFSAAGRPDSVDEELSRLTREGLLDADVSFVDGICMRCYVTGITDNGRGFLDLIKNKSVWSIVRKTLDAAGVDLSYPLLKEVCEEIVKRYVVGFIPIG